MVAQPTGTVTLLFPDVEGSTQLLERLGTARYSELLELHRRLLREAFGRHGGFEVGTEGDSFFVTFQRAEAAAAAAGEAQQALAGAAWPGGEPVRVRVGVHTGEPTTAGGNYVGMAVHQAARIMSAAHGGQVLVSETTAALLAGAPLRDLGAHRLKDLLAPIRLFQLEVEGLPGEFPPLRSLHQSTLPVAAWPLLGREPELGRIGALVSEGARLVTLTGPGGSGKTRLGLQAAAELSDEFVDGVFFVALAPLRETDAVRGTVAEAVGLEPDDDVAAWLASRRVLLVLDNLEHLPGVAAVVRELLVGETTVLATSRMALRLSGERQLPVEPLPPEAAVELFVSRAAAAGREVTADDTVAAVCHRLDNLPLALELAAARARLLSPVALLQRLDAALPLLTGGAQDLPERQRTLRATIEWSYDLLDPDAQATFRRLSVFRGSFTLEAAEALTGADLNQIATLLDQSLLKPLGDDRFFLLETLREYAREMLAEAGESDDYALRHARFYVARLEEIEPELRGPRTAEFLAWYTAEEDNLRAMLDRLSTLAAEEAAHACVLVHPYWTARGRLDEARDHLVSLLANEDLSIAMRATLLVRLSDVEERLGNLDAARMSGEQALELATSAGIRPVLCDALLSLAWVADREGDAAEAVRLGTRALEEAASLDDARRLGCQTELGAFLTAAGRLDDARASYQAAVETYRARGDAANEANALSNLASIELASGAYAVAHDTFSLAIEKADSASHAYSPASGLLARTGLGQALLGLGRREEARQVFEDAFARAFDGADLDSAWKPFFGLVLSGLAVASRPETLTQAARLRGAVIALRDQGEFLHNSRDEEDFDEFSQPLAKSLGADAWAREQAAGATLTLEETIELARSLTATASETTTTPT